MHCIFMLFDFDLVLLDLSFQLLYFFQISLDLSLCFFDLLLHGSVELSLLPNLHSSLLTSFSN